MRLDAQQLIQYTPSALAPLSSRSSCPQPCRVGARGCRCSFGAGAAATAGLAGEAGTAAAVTSCAFGHQADAAATTCTNLLPTFKSGLQQQERNIEVLHRMIGVSFP